MVVAVAIAFYGIGYRLDEQILFHQLTQYLPRFIDTGDMSGQIGIHHIQNRGFDEELLDLLVLPFEYFFGKIGQGLTAQVVGQIVG